MNVVRGGFNRQRGGRNNGNRGSLWTSNFNRGNMGVQSSLKVNSEANKSLCNRVKYQFDNIINTSSAAATETETPCASSVSVMGPPSVPLLSSGNKRNISTTNTSFNKTGTLDLSNGPQIPNQNQGFLDLSQNRGLWTPKYRQPGSGQINGSNSRGPISATHSRTTPCSSTSNTTMPESCIILALSEGRGAARGEVGLAAIDLRRPSLTLCQLSDKHSYLHTLTALHFFNPVEIIVPNTFCENIPTELYRVVKQNFSNVSVTAIQRRHFSDTQGMHYISNLCASEYASVQLQLIHKFYALTAAAAVLKYVEYIQCVVFQPNSLKIEYHCSKNSTWIDVETAVRLELVESLSGANERGGSLLSILNQASTAGGVRALRATILQPPCDLIAISDRADAVQELLDNSEGLLPGLQSVMKQLYDVDKILSLCMELPSQGGSKTGEAQLNHTIQLKNTMDLVPALLAALEMAKGKWFTTVKKDLENPKFVEINERIKRVIHDGVHVVNGRNTQHQRCFAIKSEINGLLDVARRSYSELISDIQDRVDELATTFSLPLRLNKNTTRGFHITLPVGPKNKRTFNCADLPPVFIEVQNHGVSVSMTTEDIVLLDQQSKEALSEILTMSNIVIYGLLTELRPFMSALYKLCEHVAELDVILSLAHVSSAGYYIRPMFGEYLEVKESIHPMLDYVLPVSTVPNDIFASPQYNFCIITGPNMGGKTIYIKQIALLQIMAQIGCYVPATSATFRICDKIFTRIGFNDSIECNASTYILEMKEIHHILQTISPRSLVIIDELCRGTSSEEGTSMSWAICEQLLNTSAFTFFTTHFLYLTKLQDIYLNVVNLHLTAEEVSNPTDDIIKQFVYKHKVMPGVTTLEHYGLILASNTNLPDTLVSLAKELAQVISAQKKPIPSNKTKCQEDVVLYKLAAELLHETRRPDGTDEKIQNLIKEFKKKHPDILSSILEDEDEQPNTTVESNNRESTKDTTNNSSNSSINTIPETSISEADHRNISILSNEDRNKNAFSQEDPLLPIKMMESQSYNKSTHQNDVTKEMSNRFNQMEDAQAIVIVSRKNNRNNSNSTTNQTLESLKATPVKSDCNKIVSSNEVVIGESDNNTNSFVTNDDLTCVDITEGYVDHRFENPNEIKSKRNIEQTNIEDLLSQPSTSKGIQRKNYFIAPFKTPKTFGNNLVIDENVQDFVSPALKRLNSNINSPSFSSDGDSNLQENVMMDSADNSRDRNMIYESQNRANNNKTFHNKSHQSTTLQITDDNNKTPFCKYDTKAAKQRDNVRESQTKSDDLMMKLNDIFGNEQCVDTVKYHKANIDHQPGTEELECILVGEDEQSCNSDNEDDMDVDIENENEDSN